MSISYFWKLSQFPEKVECAIHFRRSEGSFIGIEKCDTSQLAGKYSWEYIFSHSQRKMITWWPSSSPQDWCSGNIAPNRSPPPTLIFLSEQENSRRPRHLSLFVVFSMILQGVAFQSENGVGGETRELDNWRKSRVFIQFDELWLKHCQRQNGHKG